MPRRAPRQGVPQHPPKI